MAGNTKKDKRQKKALDRGIVDFMRISYHFFSDLNDWISDMADPRNSSYITYTQADYFWLGIMKNICGQKSMRSMDENFNEDACIDTLKILSGNDNLKEIPHYDSLNWYLSRLSPSCLAEIRKRMISKLIRSRVFDKNKAFGKYWRIILDGTGLFYFHERHCENCLVEKHTDEDGNIQYRYYHKVLEAKLVLSDKLVLSLDTEFIENESESVSKQDCENRAAKRLMDRIKRDFPKLRILIQADGLYANEPLMAECRKKKWKYIFTFKEGCIKTVWDEFTAACKDDEACHKTDIAYGSAEKGTVRYLESVEAYTGKKECMNVLSYGYSDAKGSLQKFTWITNLEIKPRKLNELVMTGRGRWKIENEGFNNQKNGIYDICHLNSHNKAAMKNHYLLTQIADILMQLYLSWNPLVKQKIQTIKNTSSRLLESFRHQRVSDEDVHYIRQHTSVHLE